MPRKTNLPTTRLRPIEVRTVDLLKWVHEARESDELAVRNAGDSLLTLIAFKLKEQSLWIDSDMMPHYAVLYAAAQAKFTN